MRKYFCYTLQCIILGILITKGSNAEKNESCYTTIISKINELFDTMPANLLLPNNILNQPKIVCWEHKTISIFNNETKILKQRVSYEVSFRATEDQDFKTGDSLTIKTLKNNTYEHVQSYVKCKMLKTEKIIPKPINDNRPGRLPNKLQNLFQNIVQYRHKINGLQKDESTEVPERNIYKPTEPIPMVTEAVVPLPKESYEFYDYKPSEEIYLDDEDSDTFEHRPHKNKIYKPASSMGDIDSLFLRQPWSYQRPIDFTHFDPKGENKPEIPVSPPTRKWKSNMPDNVISQEEIPDSSEETHLQEFNGILELLKSLSMTKDSTKPDLGITYKEPYLKNSFDIVKPKGSNPQDIDINEKEMSAPIEDNSVKTELKKLKFNTEVTNTSEEGTSNQDLNEMSASIEDISDLTGPEKSKFSPKVTNTNEKGTTNLETTTTANFNSEKPGSTTEDNTTEQIFANQEVSSTASSDLVEDSKTDVIATTEQITSTENSDLVESEISESNAEVINTTEQSFSNQEISSTDSSNLAEPESNTEFSNRIEQETLIDNSDLEKPEKSEPIMQDNDMDQKDIPDSSEESHLEEFNDVLEFLKSLSNTKPDQGSTFKEPKSSSEIVNPEGPNSKMQDIDINEKEMTAPIEDNSEKTKSEKSKINTEVTNTSEKGTSNQETSTEANFNSKNSESNTENTTTEQISANQEISSTASFDLVESESITEDATVTENIILNQEISSTENSNLVESEPSTDVITTTEQRTSIENSDLVESEISEPNTEVINTTEQSISNQEISTTDSSNLAEPESDTEFSNRIEQETHIENSDLEKPEKSQPNMQDNDMDQKDIPDSSEETHLEEFKDVLEFLKSLPITTDTTKPDQGSSFKEPKNSNKIVNPEGPNSNKQDIDINEKEMSAPIEDNSENTESEKPKFITEVTNTSEQSTSNQETSTVPNFNSENTESNTEDNTTEPISTNQEISSTASSDLVESESNTEDANITEKGTLNQKVSSTENSNLVESEISESNTEVINTTEQNISNLEISSTDSSNLAELEPKKGFKNRIEQETLIENSDLEKPEKSEPNMQDNDMDQKDIPDSSEETHLKEFNDVLEFLKSLPTTRNATKTEQESIYNEPSLKYSTDRVKPEESDSNMQDIDLNKEETSASNEATPEDNFDLTDSEKAKLNTEVPNISKKGTLNQETSSTTRSSSENSESSTEDSTTTPTILNEELSSTTSSNLVELESYTDVPNTVEQRSSTENSDLVKSEISESSTEIITTTEQDLLNQENSSTDSPSLSTEPSVEFGNRIGPESPIDNLEDTNITKQDISNQDLSTTDSTNLFDEIENFTDKYDLVDDKDKTDLESPTKKTDNSNEAEFNTEVTTTNKQVTTTENYISVESETTESNTMQLVTPNQEMSSIDNSNTEVTNTNEQVTSTDNSISVKSETAKSNKPNTPNQENELESSTAVIETTEQKSSTNNSDLVEPEKSESNTKDTSTTQQGTSTQESISTVSSDVKTDPKLPFKDFFYSGSEESNIIDFDNIEYEDFDLNTRPSSDNLKESESNTKHKSKESTSLKESSTQPEKPKNEDDHLILKIIENNKENCYLSKTVISKLGCRTAKLPFVTQNVDLRFVKIVPITQLVNNEDEHVIARSGNNMCYVYKKNKPTICPEDSYNKLVIIDEKENSQNTFIARIIHIFQTGEIHVECKKIISPISKVPRLTMHTESFFNESKLPEYIRVVELPALDIKKDDLLVESGADLYALKMKGSIICPAKNIPTIVKIHKKGEKNNFKVEHVKHSNLFLDNSREGIVVREQDENNNHKCLIIFNDLTIKTIHCPANPLQLPYLRQPELIRMMCPSTVVNQMKFLNLVHFLTKTGIIQYQYKVITKLVPIDYEYEDKLAKLNDY